MLNKKVIGAATAIAMQQYDMTPQDVGQFLGGLVWGLIQKDDLSKIQTCLNDCQDIQKDVTEAVNDFKKGDLQDIIAGIQLIGKVALTELPHDLQDCKGMESDVQRIESWATQFLHPGTMIPKIIQNVITHFQQIMGDVSKVDSDFTAHNFYNAGDDVADIMVQTVGPVPEMDPTDLLYTNW